MKIVHPVAINAENFYDYGVIISEANKEPLVKNDQLSFWDGISTLDVGGRTISTGLVAANKSNGFVDCLERHVKTPEIVVALESDFAILCARKEGGKDGGKLDKVELFYVQQGGAIALHSGTWHSAPLPIGEGGKYLIIFASNTPSEDFEARELAEAVNCVL